MDSGRRRRHPVSEDGDNGNPRSRMPPPHAFRKAMAVTEPVTPADQEPNPEPYSNPDPYSNPHSARSPAPWQGVPAPPPPAPSPETPPTPAPEPPQLWPTWGPTTPERLR